VFIAGGIGITPLLTMIEDLAARKYSGKYYLLYSNRDEKDVSYREILDELASQNPNFELVYFMTGECALEVKNCEMGRISIEAIRKYVLEFDSAHFYMCASRGFLEGMEKNLLSAGVGKERIHIEKW
jgi:nitric oxide dioxygenase